MGGTAGAIITCPLEVVKTRLQSSNSGFGGGGSGGGVRPPELRVSGGGPRGTATGEHLPSGKDWRKQNYSSLDRLQWSHHRNLSRMAAATSPERERLLRTLSRASKRGTHSLNGGGGGKQVMNVFECLRYIVETEGPRGLFRGLGPNLVGVAPSRAIYFFTYSTAKRNLNASVPSGNRDTPFVHVLSAAAAGFSASTCTNPIWLVKTRLQLDRATGSRELTVKQCVQSIFRSHGFVGFWKGVTASYWGISETVIHFVIYESLKKKVLERQERRKRAQRQQQQEEGTTSSSSPDEAEKKDFVDFAGFMLCGACSKTCATIVAYPHEVARTRLREEGNKYRSFWPTLATVAREEGRRGLYRGLVTQLIRQIPNTAVMMATYELTVYLMTRYLKVEGSNSHGH